MLPGSPGPGNCREGRPKEEIYTLPDQGNSSSLNKLGYEDYNSQHAVQLSLPLPAAQAAAEAVARAGLEGLGGVGRAGVGLLCGAPAQKLALCGDGTEGGAAGWHSRCGCGRRVGVERGRDTDPTRARSGPDAPRLGCVRPGAADAPSAPHSAAATGPQPDGAPRRAAAAG